MEDTKNFLHSKTLWLNVIAGIATLAQAQWGLVLDPELQGGMLVLANIILRLITKQGISAK